MNCKDLQFNLSLYSDEEFTVDNEKIMLEHLEGCPLCRVKQSEFAALKNDLRNFDLVNIPLDLQFTVRGAVAQEIQFKKNRFFNFFSSDFRHWLQYKIFPYAAGTFASLTLAFLMMMSLSSFSENLEKTEIAANRNNTTIIAPNMQNLGNSSFPNHEISISEKEYAALRQPFSIESPSFNPNGTFLQFSAKLTPQNLRDDEITFVADVFSNGLARISEVVNAPKSKKSLDDLEKALQNDPSYAPFVPAKLDNRSDVIRVVVKIQRVEVTDTVRPKRKKIN